MKSVEIVEDFTGYPAGKETRFREGETVEVSDTFAELITGKGHAREARKTSARTKENEA